VDPSVLESLLSVLRAHGVVRYRSGDLEIEFGGPVVVSTADAPEPNPEERPDPLGLAMSLRGVEGV
jgi:hypothetical protein